jgi:hypothetical protein
MDTLNLPDRISECRKLELVPSNYRRAMNSVVMMGLADHIGKVSQALDPTAPDPPLTYVQLGAINPQYQVSLNDAARCAVKWCEEGQHQDAVLRLRQALAPKLFEREYPQLIETERRLVNELATVAHAVIRLHFTGTMSPLCAIEREELSDPEPEEAA